MICKLHSDQFKHMLKHFKLKATQGRLRLLDVFQHAQGPLSIKHIEQAIGRESADIVTLYRNVESFKELGIVAEINLSNRQAYYELASLKHHHHLVCEGCGKIADVELYDNFRISKPVLENNNFARVYRHSLEFFGLCRSCDRKQ